MKIRTSILVVILTVAIWSAGATVARAQTIQVSGSIHEVVTQEALTDHGLTVTGTDSWTGTLAGDGTFHIFSGDIIDFTTPIVINVISARVLFTSDGNLFLTDLGARNGDTVNVVSTLVRGTGKFKGAKGQLVLQGVHTDIGVNFTYSGSITLAH